MPSLRNSAADTRIQSRKYIYIICSFCLLVLSPFAGCGGGGGGGDGAVELASTTPICEALLDIPARGLSCLHCTQPQARAQAETQISMLLRSCAKNIAINYLVDGTFSHNEGLLKNHIQLLTSEGRQLFVSYFLSNGPAQRRWNTTNIKGFGTKISPEEFRVRIQSDPKLQNDYQNIVRRLIPVLETAAASGAQVSLIPALEDNLTNAAFNSMVQLTLQALPANLPVAIGRSPCPHGYPGSEGGIPPGVFQELHDVNLPLPPISGGIVSNDGIDYHSPGTGANPSGVVSLDHLRMVRDAASAKNSIFILWSARAQGIPPGIQNIKFPRPSERDYRIPSHAEQLEIHAFLREYLG